MLHLLTEEEFKLERNMGKLWRGDKEPFQVPKPFYYTSIWAHDVGVWLMSHRYSYAVNIPVVKYLVDEKIEHTRTQEILFTLGARGDFGCWGLLKGICTVCSKPVYEPYPDWQDLVKQSGVMHWECGSRTDDIT